ncbi:hypothetical protein [Sphingomonas sp.]|uniref:hypothetical protein n=1 Tax=Sphingomonas sp. TaxID=28214 RepID=UPI00286E5C36|nr:hypothetical protein [Sphingomonas sp.]
MPFRKTTPQKLAAREELYALFAVTPQQIKAARDPSAPLSALAGRRQFKHLTYGYGSERKTGESR